MVDLIQGVSAVSLAPTPESRAELANAMQIPAFFVNHFNVAGGTGGVVRIAVGESPDGKQATYRFAFTITAEGATLLASLLTNTVEQMESSIAQIKRE